MNDLTIPTHVLRLYARKDYLGVCLAMTAYHENMALNCENSHSIKRHKHEAHYWYYYAEWERKYTRLERYAPKLLLALDSKERERWNAAARGKGGAE